MEIVKNLYHVSNLYYTGIFVVFDNDDQAIEYCFNCKLAVGIKLVRYHQNGSKERIKVYTSKKWKNLLKEEKKKNT